MIGCITWSAVGVVAGYALIIIGALTGMIAGGIIFAKIFERLWG